MYPSKGTMDYMSEINRLFANNKEDDIYQRANTSNFSLFSQSAINNSSSTDSTSPESFPDTSRIFHHELETPFRFREAWMENQKVHGVDGPQHELFESPLAHRTRTPREYETTPATEINQWHHDLMSPVANQWKEEASPIRRQRPIVGRKLMTSNASTPMESTYWTQSEPLDSWREESPKPSNAFIDRKNYTHSFTYELFPAENKGFDFKSPNASSSLLPASISPNSGLSPKSNLFPNSNMPSNMSPTPNIGQASSGFSRNASQFSQTFSNEKLCTFCRKNGETPSVYLTHYVKERIGSKQIVTCPILRSHVCSTCGASGDNAHTITYCPVLRSSNNGHPLQSTTITLKNTRIQSNGKRRY